MNPQLQLDIRLETPEDHRAVEELAQEAFWNIHVPGCDEHVYTHALRQHPAFIPELDLVAVHKGEVIGCIMYQRAKIIESNLNQREVICFGPLCVSPGFQSRGVGRVLVERSFELAREMGFNAVLILGEPRYYSRLGFVPANSFGIATGSGTFKKALQAFELVPGYLGGLATPARFEEGAQLELDTPELAAYGETFPAMEKALLPRQRRFEALFYEGEGVYLVSPQIWDEEAAWAFRKECLDSAPRIDGSAELEKAKNYTEWLHSVRDLEKGQDLPQGYVPASTYLGMVEGELVGIISIRHTLNDLLKVF